MRISKFSKRGIRRIDFFLKNHSHLKIDETESCLFAQATKNATISNNQIINAKIEFADVTSNITARLDFCALDFELTSIY